MDLTQAMHAATQDPPPTGIDVDQLITGERRRTRRVHAVTGLALAAALTVGAVVLPQYLSQTPSGQSPGLAPATETTQVCPTVQPTARPAADESCEDALARLTPVLVEALRRVLPDESGPVVFAPAEDGYDMVKQISTGKGALEVRLRPNTDTAAFAAKHCLPPCRQNSRQGVLLLVRSTAEVWAVRPDGTVVQTFARNTTSITEQQLIDVALTPGLTLYP